MKKKILILLILVMGVFVLASAVQAQGYLTETKKQLEATAGTKGANFGTPEDPRLVVAYVIRILLGTLGIVFVAYTVYAGFLLIISQGNEENITKAKKTIFNGILGTVIVLGSYGIVLLVSYFLTYSGPSEEDAYLKFQHKIDTKVPDFYNKDPYNEQLPDIFNL